MLRKIPGILSIQIGAKMSQSLDYNQSNEVTEVNDNDEQQNITDVIKTAEDIAFARMRVSIMKINRAPQESCCIPQKLLHRISIGSEGAMTLSFSTKGRAPCSCSAGSNEFFVLNETFSLISLPVS